MVFYGCGMMNVINKITDIMWLQLLIGIFICTVSGYIFYRIEKPITNHIVKWAKNPKCLKSNIDKLVKYCNKIAES